jgi:hypothetical protein
MNGLGKLKCTIKIGSDGLARTNTPAYCAHLRKLSVVNTTLGSYNVPPGK